MKSMCPMCLCVKKKKCAFIYFVFLNKIMCKILRGYKIT